MKHKTIRSLLIPLFVISVGLLSGNLYASTASYNHFDISCKKGSSPKNIIYLKNMHIPDPSSDIIATRCMKDGKPSLGVSAPKNIKTIAQFKERYIAKKSINDPLLEVKKVGVGKEDTGVTIYPKASMIVQTCSVCSKGTKK